MHILSNVCQQLSQKKRDSFEETSMKKYPFNKYYEFRDSNSPKDPISDEPKYQIPHSYKNQASLKIAQHLQYDKENNSYGDNFEEPIPSLYTEGLQYNIGDKFRNTKVNNLNSLKASEKYTNKVIASEMNYSSFNPQSALIEERSICALSRKIKSGKVKRTRVSSVRNTNESLNIGKFHYEPSSLKPSTTTKRKKRIQGNTKRHHKSKSRQHQHNTSLFEELDHYKGLCLNLRKQNCDLNEQLSNCQTLNRKTLKDLQVRLQKINESRVRKGEKKNEREVDDKVEMKRIFDNLKTINKKLSKKDQTLQGQHRKFYESFVDSLGILDCNASKSRIRPQQTNLLWKQMLQFLITKDFKFKQHTDSANRQGLIKKVL